MTRRRNAGAGWAGGLGPADEVSEGLIVADVVKVCIRISRCGSPVIWV